MGVVTQRLGVMPMYREPGKDDAASTLASLQENGTPRQESKEIDLYTAWDSWHQIRTVCNYNQRLLVGKCHVSCYIEDEC